MTWSNGAVFERLFSTAAQAFYVEGRPQGLNYEALADFQRFVNEKLHTRQHVQVTFIPVRPEQLESYLTEGIGDLIAYPVTVTAEREQQVAFSLPWKPA